MGSKPAYPSQDHHSWHVIADFAHNPTMLVVVAGSTALSPVLGIANLPTGLLNVGLAGYNTYQLCGITKMQKVQSRCTSLIVNDSQQCQRSIESAYMTVLYWC